jgi:hypothetical protein
MSTHIVPTSCTNLLKISRIKPCAPGFNGTAININPAINPKNNLIDLCIRFLSFDKALFILPPHFSIMSSHKKVLIAPLGIIESAPLQRS